MPARLIIKKGDTFGHLKVIKELKPLVYSGRKFRKFLFECTFEKCSNKVEVSLANAKSGHTTSCGCYAKVASVTHGLTGTPLYDVYKAMINRCYSKNIKVYKDYGGRGIKVCKEWRIKKDNQGLLNFIAWNSGLSENKQWKYGLELDRRNNDEGYSPNNCRWITQTKNSNNRRSSVVISYKGREQKLSKLIKKYAAEGVTSIRVRRRLKLGWNAEKALTVPVRAKKKSK
jgi:hypothetical protein